VETKSRTIALYAVMNKNDTKPYFYISDNINMTPEEGWTKISEQECTFDLPELSAVTPDVIAGLEERVSLMEAASAAAIEEVRGQIQSLMSIENLS
jgi:hypothetical protein